MKKAAILLALCVTINLNAQKFADLGKEKTSSVTFFSAAPLEDIDATNNEAAFILDVSTGDIQSVIRMRAFKFKKALMEEHFNENYVESTKYPVAQFKGKINEKIDLTTDKEQKVSATGKMDLHGVTKDITIEGILVVKDGNITLNAKFPIKISDYDIKVPSLYVKNIAEIVDVTISSTIKPYVKK